MRLKILVGAALSLIVSTPLRAASPEPVGADHAMVVSAQSLASDVGVDILKRGGNVVDAAVAVGYALAVVYPAAGNLGGGGFMTIRFADGRTTFLDFREKAPLAATASLFLDSSGNVVHGRSTDSWLAVGVPGSVAGLEAARERYGSLSREALIAPALALARDGFVLTDADARLFRLAADDLAKNPAASAIFVKDGHALSAGDRLQQPDLAQTLETISHDGAAAVYGGPIGTAIVAASQAGGGILEDRDFATYKVRELAPVRCSYRGFDIHAAPPPSSGGVTLCEILNIVEGFDLRGMGFHSAAEVHVLTEAMRIAYRDRNSALGDPDFVTNPVAHLIDKSYAAKVRAGLPLEHASTMADLAAHAAEGRQTTHYSIADAAGNAVSVTTTLNAWFGARRVAGTTGILVNNEMDDFTAKIGSANMFGLVQGENNVIAPGKTPLSSMTPTIITRGDKLVAVIGSPGGSRIITTVVEVIINMVDHGMTIAEAIDAPRIHVQDAPATIAIEPFALSPDTRHLLERSGHVFEDSAVWSMAQGILTGAPALSPPPVDTHALSIPDNFAQRYQLYGARDERGPTGAARGF
ncbi:gamma-glutamyltransferase [Lichenihabitans psoromatis]|uniref:gamma-glutamyltransferase n=1 Tax=Lichenihabitans psoromatis TaxID=2528642 RepID=UPI001036AAD5|nr:gamma-glutamyltransferase [Lichenihabitans psoromatis]